jgi:hypothetical protein
MRLCIICGSNIKILHKSPCFGICLNHDYKLSISFDPEPLEVFIEYLNCLIYFDIAKKIAIPYIGSSQLSIIDIDITKATKEDIVRIFRRVFALELF